MNTSNGTIFRVERNKNYTVMCNHHLKNTALSLKAKGLLSLILSLPDNWDYSVNGLISICKDGGSSVRSGIKELEESGYIRRERERNKYGQLGHVNFVVSEEPILQNGLDRTFSPDSENPHVEKPILDNPPVENPPQLNTNQSSIKKSSINQSFFPEKSGFDQSHATSWNETMQRMEGMIKKQIDYDILLDRFKAQQVNELFELVLEVYMHQEEYLYIGKEKKLTSLVIHRFKMLDFECLQSVIEGLKDNGTKIRDMKAYLLACLYNSPATKHNKVYAQANLDPHKDSKGRNASYDMKELEEMLLHSPFDY